MKTNITQKIRCLSGLMSVLRAVGSVVTEKQMEGVKRGKVFILDNKKTSVFPTCDGTEIRRVCIVLGHRMSDVN